MSLRLRRRSALAPSGFDPLSIGWHTAFWAEGDEFAAEEYAADASVGTWPDEASTNDASQATSANQPTYRASVSALNDQPAVQFVRSGSDFMTTSTFTAVTQPFAVVMVLNLASTAGEQYFFDTPSGGRVILRHTALPQWLMFAGTTLNDGTPNTGAKFLVARFDGASSTLTVNGTEILSGDAGSNSVEQIALGTRRDLSADFFDGHYAFNALYDGDLSASDEADLEGWADDHYGITIS